jgi:hypothetical protein
MPIPPQETSPTSETSTQRDHTAAEPGPRPGPRSPWRAPAWLVVVLAVAFVAIAAAGAILVVQQRASLRDREAALAAALDERDRALADAAALIQEVDQLEADLASSSDETRRELARLRRQMRALLGPPLDDGRHFGRLLAVGVDQRPPRLVIDVQQFFMGEEADQAALEDGVIQPGEHIPNDYYIRNDDPRWRTLPIDPTAEVSLTTFPFGDVDAPGVVTLQRFGTIWAADRGSITLFPFWITVEDGVVVAIEEQYLP